ncbi:ABC transporter permease [Pseudoteredinibacter isoporae]|uniref:Putative ABC transport system permease protein n=1 Tax=Pseudoteredinibacter isoporae TaxID=570281 RepID=A0A7X0JTZ8_9GAMM|nr:ABC transporter permease [Pseudoteredinibacter isoporae]MBB6522245.1 putative ABC transport system permease protein [Pseudoteredinibacter isoporae]NHO87779.1 ABC transporter permease [Pseudoteredinibacter isoporae]NIB23890.1 ABC transporter permease [Pseudoteredinibacter isoporae]
MFLRLAWFSLLSRKGSVLLTLLAISVSIFVLLGIEHIRQQAKSSFGNTVSGVDLIVGARTGDINLLLYSVFRLGNATNNISWSSYQNIQSQPQVAWSIPISLGDSHKGFRVMGTDRGYFEHFRYGQKRPLTLAQGKPFDKVFDVVLGAKVAEQLKYQLGDQLTLSHGMGSTSFSEHKDKPFRVVGILEGTGTPVDQTLHVSLQGIEAVHLNWQSGPHKKRKKAEALADLQQLEPESITAFMLGLKSKMAIFRLQRNINNFPKEPLLAILPGVTLTQLWEMMAAVEQSLQLVSALVLLASLLGLSAMLLTSIRERQREITIMRMLGASPLFIFILIQLEAMLITLSALAIALLSLVATTMLTGEWLAKDLGVHLSPWAPNASSILMMAAILLSAFLVSLAPAISAYSRAK